MDDNYYCIFQSNGTEVCPYMHEIEKVRENKNKIKEVTFLAKMDIAEKLYAKTDMDFDEIFELTGVHMDSINIISYT